MVVSWDSTFKCQGAGYMDINIDRNIDTINHVILSNKVKETLKIPKIKKNIF
jgi:hypothetical protein